MPSSFALGIETPTANVGSVSSRTTERCPVTRTTLRYDREKQELVSKAAGLAYPIRAGVPIMLPGEARELSDDERS